jgi:hypothetical protein
MIRRLDTGGQARDLVDRSTLGNDFGRGSAHSILAFERPHEAALHGISSARCGISGREPLVVRVTGITLEDILIVGCRDTRNASAEVLDFYLPQTRGMS